MSGQWRAAPNFVVFDGQSLNNFPAPPDNYPTVMMAGFPGVIWKNQSINSLSVTTLTLTMSRRLEPIANVSGNSILVMCCGTTDIWDGDSGATLYADEVAYANTARGYGFDFVIGTTLVGNDTNTTPMNDARLAHNILLLADASNAFDDVADIAANPALADWTNATYYNAGLHWEAPGALEAANDPVYGVAPVLAPFLV